MAAVDWSSVLRKRWVPYALLALGFALIPLVGWQVRVGTPEPACTGIGFGCNLSPEDAGRLWQYLYAGELVVVTALVGLLELGRSRLALARTWVATAGLVIG